MKLMILDGNSIVNRAYYGIRPLTNAEGLYTHAIYGFLMTLQRLQAEEQPQALCVAFDLHAPTFRHKADASYKATRKGMPEELRQQMPVLKEVLRAMNIPLYEKEGYEADDLIGTISRRCEEAGWECVVVTGDKDSLQLITQNTRVKLVATRMGQTTTTDMTEETFRAQYGFDPIHMIDLKALMGDSSDNIPGVAGIGEKTAMALVQRYGSIEAIYAAMPEVEAKPAVLKKLAAGEESARHSYWLATIVTDAPIDFAAEDNLIQPPKAELYELLLRLEFMKLIEKMGLTAAQESAAEEVSGCCESEVVSDAARMEELLGVFHAQEYVSVLALPQLRGVCVEWGEGNGSFAAVFLPQRLACYDEFLRRLFSAECKKISHQVKDLMTALLARGIEPEGFLFDTALAGYLLDATAGKYELEQLGMVWLNTIVPKAELYQQDDALAAIDEQAEALGAWMSHTALIDALYERMLPKLKELEMEELYFDVELPLCRVLAGMETEGIRLDTKALAAFAALLDRDTRALEEEIYRLAGHPFKINSPKQLGEVLFGEMNLPHGKKTKTGWSTSAEVLETLRWQSPLVEAVLQYRQLAKLKSTYADGLLNAVSADGRVRTSFQMTVTATGRLSSTEPNLQNIPTRTDLGSEIRKMFTAREGCVLVDADYSQIELRLLAHIANDETMLETFRRGEDIHTRTAAEVFHLSPQEVTPLMRRHAKAVNFGIVYGISAFSLSKDIGVSVAEARAYMEAYFARFDGVHRYMTEVVERAREQGYVETLWHRRRALPELSSSNFNHRAFGERVALNMPIQGTAADIMKRAMVRVAQRLAREGLRARLLLQVHDELIVECPMEEAEQVKELLCEEMEGAASLRIPLTVEAQCGKNWWEAKG